MIKPVVIEPQALDFNKTYDIEITSGGYGRVIKIRATQDLTLASGSASGTLKTDKINPSQMFSSAWVESSPQLGVGSKMDLDLDLLFAMGFRTQERVPVSTPLASGAAATTTLVMEWYLPLYAIASQIPPASYLALEGRTFTVRFKTVKDGPTQRDAMLTGCDRTPTVANWNLYASEEYEDSALVDEKGNVTEPLYQVGYLLTQVPIANQGKTPIAVKGCAYGQLVRSGTHLVVDNNARTDGIAYRFQYKLGSTDVGEDIASELKKANAAEFQIPDGSLPTGYYETFRDQDGSLANLLGPRKAGEIVTAVLDTGTNVPTGGTGSYIKSMWEILTLTSRGKKVAIAKGLIAAE